MINEQTKALLKSLEYITDSYWLAVDRASIASDALQIIASSPYHSFNSKIAERYMRWENAAHGNKKNL